MQSSGKLLRSEESFICFINSLLSNEPFDKSTLFSFLQLKKVLDKKFSLFKSILIGATTSSRF